MEDELLVNVSPVESLGMLASISESIGTTEPALKLLISLLLGYPLAFIHRKFLYGKPASIQHLYFIFGGLSLGFFNYGCSSLHSLLTVGISYATLLLFNGSLVSVLITFFFNMAYLLIGYCYSSTNDYDINWTLPQCVLVLRLIGLSFDLYDGNQSEESLSGKSKELALRERPSLLEYGGHMYFPTCFLIGPQFNMKRYQSFINGDYSKHLPNQSEPPNSVSPGIKRMLIGLGYMILFQVASTKVNETYILSDEFLLVPFWKRALLLGVWGRITLYKYISCWLLAEGACILFGLTYNGKNSDGVDKWDGVSNVDLLKFENATEFNHYIQSFNCNTNNWVLQYIYKRLKFMNNRYVSQIGVLVFLAVWHGFHSGYYVSFLFEFIVMFMEKDISSVFKKNPHLGAYLDYPVVLALRYILMRLYTFVFMGWCVAPLALLTFDRYWRLFGAVNYIGIIMFVPYGFVYGPLLKFIAKSTRPKRDNESVADQRKRD